MTSEDRELRPLLIALVACVKPRVSFQDLHPVIEERDPRIELHISVDGRDVTAREQGIFFEGQVVSLDLRLVDRMESATFPVGLIELEPTKRVRQEASTMQERGTFKIETSTNLILIGMPGAGKSTIGRELATRLDRPFIDLDVEIESETGQRLEEIIQAEGFERFLDLEAEFARNLSQQGIILATGGSVVYRPAAMVALQTNGLLIYLQAPLEELRQRLSDLTKRGVVLDRSQSLDDLYHEREPLYECYYGLKIETSGHSVSESVELIARRFETSITDAT